MLGRSWEQKDRDGYHEGRGGHSKKALYRAPGQFIGHQVDWKVIEDYNKFDVKEIQALYV